MHRVYSHSNDRAQGVIADQTVAPDGRYTRHKYPKKLRRVHYKDPDSGRKLVFLTNRTDVDALTICNLYKSRWQVELFFKNVKQNLHIKRFYGTSENAVKTQLRAAVSVYVLVRDHPPAPRPRDVAAPDAAGTVGHPVRANGPVPSADEAG